MRELPGGDALRDAVNRIESSGAQRAAVADWFDALADRHAALPASPALH